MRLRSKLETPSTAGGSRSSSIRTTWKKRKSKSLPPAFNLTNVTADLALHADTGQPPVPPDMTASAGIDDFVNSGRTGRRNALGDILDENYVKVTTSSLPFEFDKLDFNDSKEPPTPNANPEPCKDVNQTDSKTST